ncbi:MAG TPA: hypothetical protein VL523_17745 [Terriglobia bacterium]|nr:hypothetical protein [Terriglobia bacterium]
MKTQPKSSQPGGDPPRRIGVAVMDNELPKHHMLPVWFFIGVILAVYGVMIFIEGLYELSNPPGTVLESLHSAIWWGALMVVVGIVFAVKNRRPTAGGH